MASSAEIGLRTEKSEDNPHGFVHVEEVPAQEVCVVYLGGDGATDDKAANGYAKIVENEILGVIGSKVPVYSICYDFEDNKKNIARRLEFIRHRTEVLLGEKSLARTTDKATEEEYDPRYINKLFDKLLAPRISQAGGKQRLPVEEACKRIRKMTIVAHCHGGYVAFKLEKKMQEAMKKLGYSSEERKQIQSQMLVVAHAPACPLGVSKSQFVSFKSTYDLDVPQGQNWFNYYIQKRQQEERMRFNAEENKDEAGIAANRWFDFEPCYFAGKQGNLFLIKQKYEWDNDEGPFLINQDEHNDVHYVVVKQTNVGKMMAHFSRTILQNGIRNSLLQGENFVPLPPLEELILSDNPQMNAKEKRAFLKMSENGKAFRNKVCSCAMDKIKEIKQQERQR